MFDHLKRSEEERMGGTPEGVPQLAPLAELAHPSSESSRPFPESEAERLADQAEREEAASAEAASM